MATMISLLLLPSHGNRAIMILQTPITNGGPQFGLYGPWPWFPNRRKCARFADMQICRYAGSKTGRGYVNVYVPPTRVDDGRSSSFISATRGATTIESKSEDLYFGDLPPLLADFYTTNARFIPTANKNEVARFLHQSDERDKEIHRNPDVCIYGDSAKVGGNAS